MEVVVISLPTATDRRRYCSEQLGRAEIAFEFFDAIDGRRPITTHFRGFDRARYRLNTHRDPLPGEIGCYASHLAIWKRSVEHRVPMLVLEDDFELLPAFRAALPVVAALISQHGYIRLEAIDRRRRLLKHARPTAYELLARDAFRLVYLSDVPTGMTAYAINPDAAARLIAASATLIAPVDKFLQHTWEHGMPVFALTPAVVRASRHSSSSTIGQRKPLKSCDPRLLVARAVYKGRGEIQRARFDRVQLERLGYRQP